MTGLFADYDPDQQRVKRGGHAAIPGGGPEGKTCGKCRHYARVQHHDKFHLKCGLMKASWSHGSGTDIRAKDPACRFWEENTEDGHGTRPEESP